MTVKDKMEKPLAAEAEAGPAEVMVEELSPAGRAAELARQAIVALGESRSVKHGEAFAYISEKLEWAARELEARL